ncbi:4-(cytidine 5'-diphospho)-2-C-methyl-D-erythritol kinase [Devosia rhodophyticola]|uniref:4-diphosphocytidyl-2-C-methyl-D-erythritol kinase n=1 Tax=Devosia rhodophyticola TaxID=3026423 RepID=A0ABY7YYQ3_9HYPH|nr:4-(cytidine 5'-diphospho)-2-C-methyl-D-erythritol kinase [Devosia rhodophyticola]WDR06518.1 4-(cytidine 5'-diphospho)-2-C-methyl-D-erythritol kinase [Devosia rhodophyticola]
MTAEQLAVETAPAKINLALHVIGRRDNGYHDIESLFVFAEVADELHASAAEVDSLVITGPFGEGLSNGETNLVARAIAGFRARWPDNVPHGLALELRKNIPIAAGLGGGSADAAAALRLMARLGQGTIDNPQLFALAAELGADVPACLISQPLLARGVGEVITPLAQFPACHIVLVNPMIQVSTADVFKRMNGYDNYPLPALPSPLTRPAQLGIWLAETRNDLQPPAVKIVPEIGTLIDRLAMAPGCILARMSGSGATVFGLFGSNGQAHQAAHELRASPANYWVTAAPLIVPDQ